MSREPMTEAARRETEMYTGHAPGCAGGNGGTCHGCEPKYTRRGTLTRAGATEVLLASWRTYKHKAWLRARAGNRDTAIPFTSTAAKGWALMIDGSCVRVTAETANIARHKRTHTK